MFIKHYLLAFLLAIALVSTISPARAISLESVLMPGQVIRAHAKLEERCSNCHVRTDRGAQDRLCKDCHKDVAKDIAMRQGYHGKPKDLRTCRSCHTEHKGRDARVVVLDEKHFDHAQTDFLLNGKHTDTECAKCHRPGAKFRSAQSACLACHRKDDKHKGALGAKCADCHTEKNWEEARFDHAKTRFKLLDKHEKVECAKCHRNQQFKSTPLACAGCHKADDKHKGRFGAKCETCHTARGWKELTFDHDTDTHYALRGKHREVKCTDCHGGMLYRDKLQTNCVDCHRKDDKHKESLGTKCADCHVERTWKEARFDHAASRFPLKGKHIDAKCDACHKSPVFKDAPTACYACHRKDDKHKGTLGERCEQCHAERTWRENTFDHGKTRFALLGKHLTTKCEDCHPDNRYKNTPQECLACHRKDDQHKGQEGGKCEQCHNAQTWKQTTFTHARSRFALTGKHLSVACDKCHLSAQYKDARMECAACHDKDDAHKRKLGAECASCHNARGWKLWDFNHDSRTRFRLDGGHLNLSCEACHGRPVTGKPSLSMRCAECHDKDDIHQGNYGQACEKCHVTSTFKTVKLHAGQSSYPDGLVPPRPKPLSRG